VATYATDWNDTTLVLREESCSVAIGCKDDFRGFNVAARSGDGPATGSVGNGRDGGGWCGGLEIHAFLKGEAEEM
jgi:hypothetical protein